MLFSRRRKLIAVVVGVLLVSAPFAGFSLWLSYLSEQQSFDEASKSARRGIAVADGRIRTAIASLNDLVARGVNSCSAANVEALRQATFTTSPIKEFSIVAADGRTLCTDTGLLPGTRKLVSPQLSAAPGETVVEVMRVGERNFARIRHFAQGGTSIAGLVPADLFVPQASSQGGSFSAYLLLTTANGSPIAEFGTPPKDGDDAYRFQWSEQSKLTGIKAVVHTPLAQTAATYEDLRDLALVVTSIAAISILSLCLLLMRRQTAGPVAEIERALAAGEFVPYFQPIVDIKSGRLRGVETLIRWRKPDGSIVLPGAFIPLVESSGLIVPVTRALMRRVRDEVGAAFEHRPYLRVAFNLAAQHFADETIVKDVRNTFKTSPIKFDQIVLEVTERQPLESLTETRRVIAALQGLGVKIAIDDVGTGHSGLSYMLKLGVDIIKIDKMFIDAVGTDRNSAKIIETLIELAHNMRMEVIAEGVETFEQVMFLRDLGIRSAQGYVFAPPLPTSAFLQLVEAIDPLPKDSLDAGTSASQAMPSRSAA